MRYTLLALVALAIGLPSVASTERLPPMSPAPAGDAAAVSLRIIHDNFAGRTCPRIRQARRLSDGSIRTTCSNGEAFRVFTLDGEAVALRCSAAAELGIQGC